MSVETVVTDRQIDALVYELGPTGWDGLGAQIRALGRTLAPCVGCPHLLFLYSVPGKK